MKQITLEDLELITKWLDTKKRDIKETLNKSYIKNVDYIVFRLKSKTHNNYKGIFCIKN